MDNKKFFLLDGAMGTMLQAAGLPGGSRPELWNLTNADVVTSIQRQYVEAGSNLIYANTFGANGLNLAASGHSVAEVVAAGVAAAKKACEGTDTKVALDIGPLGQLLEPLGTLPYEKAYELFSEMLVAGEAAGADVVIFETMSDLREVKAGVLAAKDNTKLPIMVTMTFEKSARTFVGVTVPAMAQTLDSLGVAAMGFNCSLGPKDLMPLISELAKHTDKPIILKPNAGLPDAEGKYTIDAEAFAQEVMQAVDLGVHIFGGCCGTAPAYIAALKAALADKTPVEKPERETNAVCSASIVLDVEEDFELGTSIHPENDDVIEAIEDEDLDALSDVAMEDTDEDAELIQVFLPEENEEQMLPRAVEHIQMLVHEPLLLRAHSINALEKAIRVYNGRPAVYVTNDEERALCEKYGAYPYEA